MAKPSLGQALGGFLLDVVLAIVIMALTQAACFFAWTLWLIAFGRVNAHNAAAMKHALDSPSVLVLLCMAFIATATAAGALYAWRRPATAMERAASQVAIRQPRTWLWIAATVMIVLAMTTGITALGRHLGVDVDPSNLDPIKQAMVLNPAFVCIFAVALAPIYEEILCRRVFFGRLWAAGWPKLGMLLSGTVFASMHEMPGLSGHTLVVTMFTWIPYLLMGIAFAWVYRRTGTLWASIITHGVNNAMAMLTLTATFGGS